MAIFYVSPNGNDNQSGLDATSAFATLARAQEAMRQSGSADTTYVAGGSYTLGGPITLNAADSGSAFVALDGQTPIVSGGTPVTGWTQGSNGIWTAHVDAPQMLQLTVDGVRQTESRFPDVDPTDPVRGGWLWGQELPAGHNPLNSLAFDPADFPAGHAPEAGQRVTVFSENGYASDQLTIQSVQGNVITFAGEANYDLGPASRFYVSEATPDNVGEWSFNAQTQTVSYRAPAGFDGQGAVASGDQSLFVVDGASDVTFRGLTFANTAASNGDPERAAIEVHDASGLTIDGNHFSNVGLGVVLNGDSSGNTITGNTFSDIWASAIALTPGTSGNTISHNVIDRANDTFVQFGAIDMHESGGNQIDHNTISNVPRFAIAENNYDPGIASGGNTIEYNDINHAGQATPDVGAIYLFSHADPDAAGDIIRYNKIVDAGGVNTTAGAFVPGQDMSSGIYLDDLASNAKIYGNYVEGTSFSGIFIHGGSNNEIHDNTLMENGKYGISTVAVEGFAIDGNETYNNFIQVSRDGSNSIDTDQSDPALIHGNIYYNPDGSELTVADVSLAAFQARGGDLGATVTTEAGFIDAAAGDYGFASGSAGAGLDTAVYANVGSSIAGSAAPVVTGPDVVTPTAPEPDVSTPIVVPTPSTPVVADPATPAAPAPSEPSTPVTAEPSTPAAPVVAEPATPAPSEPSTPVVTVPDTAAPVETVADPEPVRETFGGCRGGFRYFQDHHVGQVGGDHHGHWNWH